MKEGLYFKKRHYDHFRPMTTYCVQGDKLLVDEILLLADIDNELKRINDVIGKVALTKENQSQDAYENLRTRANIDKVYNLYASDKALHDSIANLK